METEATKVPSFISNRPVRILLFGVALIVVCVVLVGVAVTLLRSSRNSPISVDIYPGSQLITSSKNDKEDVALYATQDSVQQVLDFYSQRLPKDSESVSVQGCQKIYTDSNTTTRELPGHFYARCVEDNSQLDVVQQLLITINYQINDATKKPETRFQVERHWGS
jgi:hypothetical protein